MSFVVERGVLRHSDLPDGCRWATADECEEIAATGRTTEHIVVPLTYDSTGKPYTQGEADVAIRYRPEQVVLRRITPGLYEYQGRAIMRTSPSAASIARWATGTFEDNGHGTMIPRMTETPTYPTLEEAVQNAR